MPLPILGHALLEGMAETPLLLTGAKVLPVVLLLYVIKRYFQGAKTLAERNMHGKVIMVTGGTSGIGAEIVRGLASRGAQIILLTRHPLDDAFLVDHIQDVRERAGHELITAERVDLSSLHSIRAFATKWIDNAPPRRLDMLILCGNVMLPPGSQLQSTDDGLELNWALNYVSNYHLLSILSPALGAQAPDRDVRVIIGTCISYLAGEMPLQVAEKAGLGSKESGSPDVKVSKGNSQPTTRYSASSAYASSKLALMTYAQAFQRQLNKYKRPDGQDNNARVILVDPGYTRTPGMQRYLTWGSLIGLALYIFTYPFWWFVLKSPEMGAQSFLHAAMEAEYARGPGGILIRECRNITVTRDEVKNEAAQKALLEYSERIVEEAEKRGALARARAKKAAPAESSSEKKAEPKSTTRP